MNSDDFVKYVTSASEEWFDTFKLISFLRQRNQRVYQFLAEVKSDYIYPQFVVDTFIKLVKDHVAELKSPFFVNRKSRGEKQSDGSFKITIILSGVPEDEPFRLFARKSRFEETVMKIIEIIK